MRDEESCVGDSSAGGAGTASIADGILVEESAAGASSAGGGDRDEETTGKAKAAHVSVKMAGSSRQNKKVRTRKQ